MSGAVELQIESLVDDGRGLARRDGKVAFVAGALGGETVLAERVRTHRRFDEYRLLSVVSASAERVPPLCPLVGDCGGCDLQHLEANAQLDHKQQALTGLLARQAGLVAGHLDEPLRSRPFGYRRRARLAVHVPRRGAPRVGFRSLDGRTVVPVAECPVLERVLSTLPGELGEAVARFRRPRNLGHLELYVSESIAGDPQPLIHAHTVEDLDPGDLAALAELAGRHGGFASTRNRHGSLHWLHRPGTEAPGYRLPDFGLRLAFEPGDFLQGNGGVNRALVARVVDILKVVPGLRVLEAFAGIGNLTLPLARRGAEVVALEGVAGMVERAAGNASANGLSAQFTVSDLSEPHLPAGQPIDAAVLNPPRSGALPLVQALAARRVERVLYVSCSPPTLARDAAALGAAGYRLLHLGVVDMLPQTHHIESVALFSR